MRWDAEVRAAVNQALALRGVALDPALVHAVIQRESGHRDVPAAGTLEPNGRRSYGPMQVMDTTAAMHGITDPRSLNIPSLGIRIGTLELARLFKLFPGDSARAIAAYNAGPGNAARNPATGRFINQAYVDAVLGFWNTYRGAAVPAGLLLAVAIGALLLSRRRRLAKAAA